MKKSSKATRRPYASRPQVPGYGIPKGNKGMLPWKHVQERMAQAMTYWIGTTGPDGRPYATPVWGVWLDETLYFDGSPGTRRGRNIAANPAVVVHLEDGMNPVILHGDAHEIRGAELALRVRLSEAYSAKYTGLGYAPGPDTWKEGGLYSVQPRVAFAWTKFPKDATRWRW